MKKLIATAAATMGLAAAAATSNAEVAPSGKPKKAAKKKAQPLPAGPTPKGFPTKADLKKMPVEKRKYWEARIRDSKMPSWWNKKRNVQGRAARVKAELPDPMTRQVRRQLERKGEQTLG